MAALDPRIGIAIVIVIVLLLLFLLGYWAYTQVKEALENLWKLLPEPSDQPVEEPGTEEPYVPGTGDTGSPDPCGLLPGPAPNADACGQGSCAPSPAFCVPCQSEEGAKLDRDFFADTALEAIGGVVGPRVIPVWKTYLYGGTPEPGKNYSADFGEDFATSDTTLDAVDFLLGALEDSLIDDPPRTDVLPPAAVSDRIGDLYEEDGALEDPGSGHMMDFDDFTSIPGNLAGGAGTDQADCPAGAEPSAQRDQRRAQMKVRIDRLDAASVEVTPLITFMVRDTVDLCPGNCGKGPERAATVPFSRYEATGISGDVPFWVRYEVAPDPFELELPEPEDGPVEEGR